MQTSEDDGLHTKLLQKDVKVGLEESAVAALGNYVVLFAEVQLGNHLGTLSANNSMVTPDDQFTIDAGQVSIVAEDDGYAGSTGCVEQFCSSGYDCLPSVAREPVTKSLSMSTTRMAGLFSFSICLLC